MSLGCVRTRDDELVGLLDWLEDQGALGRPVASAGGESQQGFLRRARIIVR